MRIYSSKSNSMRKLLFTHSRTHAHALYIIKKHEHYTTLEKASLNKWVLRRDLKVDSEEVSCKDFGREFQALAIAEEGERSPYLRFLFGTWRSFLEEERNVREGLYLDRESDMYWGREFSKWRYAKRANLYWILKERGSQWSCIKRGVMWSRLRFFSTRRAALFWTRWRRRSWSEAIPEKEELQ